MRIPLTEEGAPIAEENSEPKAIAVTLRVEQEDLAVFPADPALGTGPIAVPDHSTEQQPQVAADPGVNTRSSTALSWSEV